MQVKYIAFVLTATLSLGASASNLVPDGGFAENAARWASPGASSPSCVDGKLDASRSFGPAAGASLRFDWKKGGACYMKLDKPVPVKPGEKMEIAFRLVSTGWTSSTRGIVSLSAAAEGSKKEFASVKSPWTRDIPEWELFSAVVTVPAGVTSANLALRLFGGPNEAGTAWVDDVYFGPVRAVAAPPAREIILRRGVARADHLGVWHPDESMVYDFEYMSNTLGNAKLKLAWRAEDFEGRPVASGSAPAALKPGAGKIPLDLGSFAGFRGWFALKAELMSGERAVAGVTSAGIVVERQTGRRDPFFTCKDGGSYELQRRMGNGSISYMVQRRYLQTADDSYKRDVVEKVVSEAEREGFAPFFQFMVSQHSTPVNQLQPPYCRERVNAVLAAGGDPYDEAYYNGWRSFISMLNRDYSSRISEWFISDEIYNIYHQSKFEVPHYLAVQKILHETVKAANPSNVVGGCGTFMDRDPIGEKMWPLSKDYVDGLSCSIYLDKTQVGKGMRTDGPETGGLLKRFKRTRDVIGPDKFIACMESGYACLNFPELDSPEQKNVAEIVARNFILVRYLGVRKWTWFTFINDSMYERAKYGYGRTDYGMWNERSKAPKPYACSYAVSARVLANVTNGRDASPRPDIYAYTFRREDGKTLLAMWAFTDEPVKTEIDIPRDWTGCDFLGRPSGAKAGRFMLDLGKGPVYFVTDASQDAMASAVAAGKYSMPELYVGARRVSSRKVSVYAVNKSGGALDTVFRLGRMEKKVSLRRDETREVSFTWPVGNGNAKAAVTTPSGEYAASFNDDALPVKRLSGKPVLSPDGVFSGLEGVKPILLDSRDTLKPDNVDGHAFWTGRDDLSAAVYLAYDENAFYVAGDVTDDINTVRSSGSMSWNQDALQFAFDIDNDAFDPKLSSIGYAADDREFVAAMTPEGPETYCHYGPASISKSVRPYRPEIVRRDGRTLYLSAIPWREIGLDGPRPGAVFGFSTVIFDVDHEAGVVAYWMELAPGIVTGKAPAEFRRIVLED